MPELDLDDFPPITTNEIEKPKKRKITSNEKKKKLEELTQGLPSASKAMIDAIRYCPRKPQTFTQVPVIIDNLIEEKRKKTKNEDGKIMGKKEFWYHCLRLAGIDIPSYKDIHGKRRS